MSAGRRRCLSSGEEGWPLEADGHPSIKLQQVTQWQQEGVAVRIVGESDWLRLLGLDGRCREVHSLYTPAMLSQSLNVPIGTIRRWERLGLIRPVRKVYRLPYFDYSEAAGVRRLSELLAAGVPPAAVRIEPGQALDDAARHRPAAGAAQSSGPGLAACGSR